MSDQIKLKPCPFCGANPESGACIVGKAICYFIECPKCGISRKTETNMISSCSFSEIEMGIKNVVEAWNMRILEHE